MSELNKVYEVKSQVLFLTVGFDEGGAGQVRISASDREQSVSSTSKT